MINAASSLVVLGAGHDDTVATPLYSCTRPRPPLRPSQPAPPTPASTASPTPTPNPQPQALPKPPPPPARVPPTVLMFNCTPAPPPATLLRVPRGGQGAVLGRASTPPWTHPKGTFKTLAACSPTCSLYACDADFGTCSAAASGASKTACAGTCVQNKYKKAPARAPSTPWVRHANTTTARVHAHASRTWAAPLHLD